MPSPTALVHRSSRKRNSRWLDTTHSQAIRDARRAIFLVRPIQSAAQRTHRIARWGASMLIYVGDEQHGGIHFEARVDSLTFLKNFHRPAEQLGNQCVRFSSFRGFGERVSRLVILPWIPLRAFNRLKVKATATATMTQNPEDVRVPIKLTSPELLSNLIGIEAMPTTPTILASNHPAFLFQTSSAERRAITFDQNNRMTRRVAAAITL
jgi:hypothetical protein